MHRIIITIVLLIGLFYSLVVLASGMRDWRLPDNQRGYSPERVAAVHREASATVARAIAFLCEHMPEADRRTLSPTPSGVAAKPASKSAFTGRSTAAESNARCASAAARLTR